MAEAGSQGAGKDASRRQEPGGDRAGQGPLAALERQLARGVGEAGTGRSWTTVGLLLAGLGVVMFPIGGIVGAVCGAIGYSRGDRLRGVLAVVASIVSFVLSFVVAAFLLRRLL